jgi:serine/alanine adding enzyme
LTGVDAKLTEIKTATVAASDEKSMAEISRFTSLHNYPSPFQSGELFKVYSKTKGCKPTAMIARNPEGEMIASLVATTFMDAGVLAGTFLSHVSVRGGPLFIPRKEGVAGGTILLKKLLTKAKAESLYTRVYPLFDQPDQLSLLKESGFTREDWLNYLIDLTAGEQVLREKLTKHRRKGIQKAENLGLEVVDASSVGDIDTLYSLLLESHARAKIPLQDKSLFEAIHGLLVPKGMARMIMACSGGKPIAARVALAFSGIVYDWYAGSTAEAEETNANEFLAWRLMTWGCASGFRLFDFGGAGLPEEEYGPREFKRRFGGQLVNLGRYTVVHKPKMLKMIQNLYKVRRRI